MSNITIQGKKSTDRTKPEEIHSTSNSLHNKVTDQPAQAQTYNYKNRFTGTAAALGTTSDVSILGLPFDSLTFTKSAGTNTGTIDVHLTPNGGIIDISALNAETIAITATSDGNIYAAPIAIVDGSVATVGTIRAATGLVVGIYYIYLGG